MSQREIEADVEVHLGMWLRPIIPPPKKVFRGRDFQNPKIPPPVGLGHVEMACARFKPPMLIRSRSTMHLYLQLILLN